MWARGCWNWMQMSECMKYISIMAEHVGLNIKYILKRVYKRRPDTHAGHRVRRECLTRRAPVWVYLNYVEIWTQLVKQLRDSSFLAFWLCRRPNKTNKVAERTYCTRIQKVLWRNFSWWEWHRSAVWLQQQLLQLLLMMRAGPLADWFYCIT